MAYRKSFTDFSRGVVCCSLFVLWVLTLQCSAEVDLGNFTMGRHSWKDLRQEAGYFSSSGIWKGGFPRQARQTIDKVYGCTETHEEAGFCLEWNGGTATSGDIVQRERCTCSQSSNGFCQEWLCRHPELPKKCSRATIGCLKNGKIRFTSCSCLKGAVNENSYCYEWKCTRFNVYGVIEQATWQCIDEDLTGRYCGRWEGDFDLKNHVKTSICYCFERETDHCLTWLCEEREISKCSSFRPIWCKPKFALWVFGTIGLFFMVAAAVIFNVFTEVKPYAFIIPLILLTVPWFILALISGGGQSIGWVLLMWAAPWIVLRSFSAFKIWRKKRNAVQNN